MKLTSFSAAALVVLSSTTLVSANVRLATLFRDGAILQRNKPIVIWGWADAGEDISVSFHGQAARATADKAGRWSVQLAPEKASAEPSRLEIRGKDLLAVNGVLIGDV